MSTDAAGKKILFVTPLLDSNGGVQVQLRRLIPALVERGAEVWCFTGGTPVTGRFTHRVDTRIHGGLHVDHAAAVARDLARLIEQERFDLVKVDNMHDPELLSVIARHRRSVLGLRDYRLLCPVGNKYLYARREICTVPAGPVCFWRCFRASFEHAWTRRAMTTAYPRFLAAQRVTTTFWRYLASSEYVAREAALAGVPRERVQILYPFVDRSPAPAPLPGGPFRVTYVSRMEHLKGGRVLLAALAKLPDVHATFVGTGSRLEELRTQSRQLELEARVEFTGDVPNARVRDQLCAGHLHVVPSEWAEVFGGVGIEAMGVGRAVVASRAGGMPEWLRDGETGVLVAPGDPDALADAIRQLQSDPARLVAMGQNGWQRAATFSAENALDVFLGLMRS